MSDCAGHAAKRRKGEPDPTRFKPLKISPVWWLQMVRSQLEDRGYTLERHEHGCKVLAGKRLAADFGGDTWLDQLVAFWLGVTSGDLA